MGEMIFSAQEYAVLLEWYMVSDPWPLTERKHDVISDLLNREAEARGYDDWVHAYHEFELEADDG